MPQLVKCVKLDLPGHSFGNLLGSGVTNVVGVRRLIVTGKFVHDLNGVNGKNACHDDHGDGPEASHYKRN